MSFCGTMELREKWTKDPRIPNALGGRVFPLHRRDAIREWLQTDEVVSHSQTLGRAWNLRDPNQVDDLVDFLDRAVRGINAVLEGGLPSATGGEAPQELAVPEVREEVQQPSPGVRGDVRGEQGPRQAGGDEAGARHGGYFTATVNALECPSWCVACMRDVRYG